MYIWRVEMHISVGVLQRGLHLGLLVARGLWVRLKVPVSRWFPAALQCLPWMDAIHRVSSISTGPELVPPDRHMAHMALS